MTRPPAESLAKISKLYEEEQRRYERLLQESMDPSSMSTYPGRAKPATRNASRRAPRLLPSLRAKPQKLKHVPQSPVVPEPPAESRGQSAPRPRRRRLMTSTTVLEAEGAPSIDTPVLSGHTGQHLADGGPISSPLRKEMGGFEVQSPEGSVDGYGSVDGSVAGFASVDGSVVGSMASLLSPKRRVGWVVLHKGGVKLPSGARGMLSVTVNPADVTDSVGIMWGVDDIAHLPLRIKLVTRGKSSARYSAMTTVGEALERVPALRPTVSPRSGGDALEWAWTPATAAELCDQFVDVPKPIVEGCWKGIAGGFATEVTVRAGSAGASPLHVMHASASDAGLQINASSEFSVDALAWLLQGRASGGMGADLWERCRDGSASGSDCAAIAAAIGACTIWLAHSADALAPDAARTRMVLDLYFSVQDAPNRTGVVLVAHGVSRTGQNTPTGRVLHLASRAVLPGAKGTPSMAVAIGSISTAGGRLPGPGRQTIVRTVPDTGADPITDGSLFR
jgi:hypothetical protein